MRDYTDERDTRQERTNIVFYGDDLDCIADIKKFVGVRGKAAAVRYALRHTRDAVLASSQAPTPNVLIPTNPPADKEA